jgi:NitT/TauT family transport system substrate-binding protein
MIRSDFTRAALGSLVALAPATLRAQTLAPWPAAATATEGDAIMWLAQSQGYFARAGVALDITNVRTGEESAAALVAGKIVVCSMNSMSLAIAHQNGIDIKVIAGGGEWVRGRGGTQMMVLKNSPLTTGSDFNGKTVGVSVLHGQPQISAMAWIDAHGGDSKTVHFIEIPFASMQAALESGRVDGAPIPQPFATTAQATCRSLGLPNDAIAPAYLIGVYTVMASWAAANKDAARRMRTALFACAHWYNTDPAASVDAVAAITKQDPVQVANSVRSYFGERVTPDLLQPIVDVGFKYGLLKARFPAADLIAQL